MADKQRQQGLGLVEILVALTLGLFLMSGIIQVFVASKQSYRTTEALSRVQDNGRFATSFIALDVRSGGFNPLSEACGGLAALTTDTTGTGIDDGSGNLRIVLNNPTAYESTFDEGLTGPTTPLDGYEDYEDGDWPGAPETNGVDIVTPGTDVLVLERFSTNADRFTVTGPAIEDDPSGSNDLELDSVSGIEDDDILLAMDEECSFGAVFQVTGVDSGANTISHASIESDPTAPNRIDALGKGLEGGTVVAGISNGVQQVAYYIATGASGESSLFRRIGTAAPEELADGVEDMQITYGEDTDGDSSVDNYVTANNVTNMGNVLAVRITLRVASPEANVLPEDQTLNGVTYTDRRLRQIFTTTIGIRSRIL